MSVCYTVDLGSLGLLGIAVPLARISTVVSRHTPTHE
jgi:hypothetical protein